MKSRIKTCVKCGSKKITSHHLYPRVHYGVGVRVPLCATHHRELEIHIQSGEGLRNGLRRKNPRQYYLDCVLEYLVE